MSDTMFNGGITLACSVRNISEAVAWYEQKLGFNKIFEVDGWAEVATSAKDVSIGLGTNENPTQGGHTPVFGVRDIEAAKRALEGRGVKFKGEIMTLPGLVKLANFEDLDGNPLMLSQSLAT